MRRYARVQVALDQYSISSLFLLVILLLFSNAHNTNAQQIYATASSSKNEYLVGDRINVYLDIKMPQNYKVEWHNQAPDPQKLESADSVKKDSFSLDQSIEIKFQIPLAGFDSGQAIYPSQEFWFRKNGDTGTIKVRTQPIVFQIKTITVDLKKDIKPILSPLDPGMDFLQFIEYLLGGLVIIILVITLYILWRNKRKRKREAMAHVPVIVRPPWEYAIEKLAELKLADLPSKGETKEYYIDLSSIIRQYIHDLTDIDALEITTDELVELLNSRTIDKEYIASISGLLSLADSVKFAKYHPEDLDNSASIDTAFDIVQKMSTEYRQ